MEALYSLFLFVLLAAAAWGCAVPHGGCLPDTCAKYKSVSPSTVAFSANYTDPNTWLQRSLPLIGYYVGLYNKAPPYYGTYDINGVPGTPALNYERFNLETNIIDPKTNLPYAQLSPTGEGTITACCNKCAATDWCWLYQFYYITATTGKCYLLSGGSSDYTDYPGYGVPFSGSHSDQGSKGIQANVPLNFVGGRCNGQPGIKADPHFVGAHGVEFDFNGQLEKSFCLYTDSDVHINGLLKGYYDNRTEGASVGGDGKALRSWIREAGFLWKDEAGRSQGLRLIARSGKEQARKNGFLKAVVVNQKEVARPSVIGASVIHDKMNFTFLGTKKVGKFDEDMYSLVIGDVLDMSVSLRTALPKYQTETEAQAHFNMMINKIKSSPKVHGVLGQTYRKTKAQINKVVKYKQLNYLLHGAIQADGESGKGFLDGDVKDYITSSVTASDCKFTQF